LAIKPELTKEKISTCKTSWLKIQSAPRVNKHGSRIKGATVFYNSFFDELHKKNINYKEHFSSTFKGGHIIFAIIKLVIEIDVDNLRTTIKQLKQLGTLHKNMVKPIGSNQYSELLLNFLPAIESNLDGLEGVDQASLDKTINAWQHALAFILKHFLLTSLTDEDLLVTELVEEKKDECKIHFNQ